MMDSFIVTSKLGRSNGKGAMCNFFSFPSGHMGHFPAARVVVTCVSDGNDREISPEVLSSRRSEQINVKM